MPNWIGLGFSSLLDQGLISVSNFFLSITCARVLGASHYGAFVIASSAFLFASGFHNALILEPMSVLAGQRPRAEAWDYLRATLVMHVMLILCITAILGLSSWAVVYVAKDLSKCFFVLALAGPVILLFWLLRRACYIWLQPIQSAAASLLYALSVFVMSMVFQAQSFQRVWMPFVIMGAASAIACAYLTVLLLRRVNRSHVFGLKLRAIIASHLNYSRWSIGVTLAYSLGDSAYPSILGLTCGVSAAGQFRAAENLFLPMMQVISAFSLLLLPRAARGLALGGYASLRRFALRSATAMIPAAALYGLLVLLCAPMVSGLLYGNKFPTPALALLVPLAVALIGRAAYDISLVTTVRSTGSARYVFYATTLGALLTWTSGFYLSESIGVAGAAISRVLSTFTQACLLLFFVGRIISPKHSGAHAKSQIGAEAEA